MELPIFLLNDQNRGVSAYHDRKTLDAAVISMEDAPHLTVWSAVGERLVLKVNADRWQIAPSESRIADIELLRDLLVERLTFWYPPTAQRIARDRIIERAAAYFKVREPPSRWQVLANSVLPFLRPWPS